MSSHPSQQTDENSLEKHPPSQKALKISEGFGSTIEFKKDVEDDEGEEREVGFVSERTEKVHFSAFNYSFKRSTMGIRQLIVILERLYRISS